MRVLSLALVCLFGCAGAPAQTEFKVMSFNLRYGTANDGENHWDKRKDLLVDTIRQQSPAVMGSQECLDSQADYISEKLPEYRWIGIGRERYGTGEMAAVHYKYKELVPVSYNAFWLSKWPDDPGSRAWDAALTRIATYVKFFQPKTGHFIHYFNTHFDHMGQQAREESGKLLGARVAAITDGEPIIVTGDFNAIAEKSVPWDNLIAAGGLTDAWVAAPEKVGPVATWCDFKDPEMDSNRRIDWILYRNGVQAKRCETVVNKVGGRYPSDHFPVTALLRLPF